MAGETASPTLERSVAAQGRPYYFPRKKMIH